MTCAVFGPAVSLLAYLRHSSLTQDVLGVIL